MPSRILFISFCTLDLTAYLYFRQCCCRYCIFTHIRQFVDIMPVGIWIWIKILFLLLLYLSLYLCVCVCKCAQHITFIVAIMILMINILQMKADKFHALHLWQWKVVKMSKMSIYELNTMCSKWNIYLLIHCSYS